MFFCVFGGVEKLNISGREHILNEWNRMERSRTEQSRMEWNKIEQNRIKRSPIKSIQIYSCLSPEASKSKSRNIPHLETFLKLSVLIVFK